MMKIVSLVVLSLSPFLGVASANAQGTASQPAPRALTLTLESQSVSPSCVADGRTDCLPAFMALKSGYLYNPTHAPSGMTINLGPGAYYFSAPLDMSGLHGMTISGAGNLSTAVSVGSGDHPVFIARGTYAAPVNAIFVRNLAIECGGMSKANAHGVQWAYINGGGIENVRFHGCNHAIDLTGQWQTRLLHNYIAGGGAQQNAVCLFMQFPTDPQDLWGNNAVIADHNVCQGAAKYGARLVDANGSVFVQNQWMATEVGVYACDQPSKRYPSGSDAICEFMFFNQDQTDTTKSNGWKFRLGSGGGMGPGIVVQQPWIGSSNGVAIDIQGGSSVQVSDASIVRADIGIRLLGVTNSRFSGTIQDYNRSNDGSPAVLIGDMSKENDINVVTTTTNYIAKSYNGIIEAATARKNRIYGGESPCALGLSVGGSAGMSQPEKQSCSYEIQGLEVNVQFFLGLPDLRGRSGVATLVGLPIAAADSEGGWGYGAVAPILANGVVGLNSPVLSEVIPGQTGVNLYLQGASGISPLQASNFLPNATLTGRIQYIKR